jgi:hypothetical protein
VNPKYLEARWKNSVRIAARIKFLLDQGYVVRDGDGQRIVEITVGSHRIDLVTAARLEVFSWKDERAFSMGLTIDAFNMRFKAWTYTKPEHVMPLFPKGRG